METSLAVVSPQRTYPKHQAEEEEDGLGDDDSAVHVCVRGGRGRTEEALWSSLYQAQRRSAARS